MQSLNHIKDFCRFSNNKCRFGNSDGNSLPGGFGLACIIILGVLISSGSVYGQFSVQPMKIELPVTPGKIVRQAVEIRNHDPNEMHVVDTSIVELSQWEDASWMIIEPNSPYDISTLSSCSKWISITPSTSEVGPLESTTIMVDVKIPRGVRGFFVAGILASLRPRPEISDVTVSVRFLIPVLVQIQSRIPKQQINLDEVGMDYKPALGVSSAKTYITMNISNKGGTYSRLKPLARLWNFSDGHWRLIKTAEFDNASIIPGINLKLKYAMPEALPSGKYKIVGALYVDGRISNRVQRILDFTGETNIGRLSGDVPLDLIPGDIVVESVPGATKLASIKVINASEEPVHIQTATGLPPELRDVAISDLKGEDLDCTNWISVSPQNFTLPSNGQQSLTITSSMPSTSAMHPCYYSLIALWASYPDGKDAGVTRANICLNNTQIEVQPVVDAAEVKLAHLGGSKYIVSAKFINFGSVHVTPIKCSAIVSTETGVARAISSLTCQKAGFMLPLEVRIYSGVVDFVNIPAGLYYLTAGLEYLTDVRAKKQIAIRVSIEGEERLVEVVRMENDIPNIVEVQW